MSCILQQIVERARDLHMVDIAKISLIPDVTLSNPSSANFRNREGRCIETALQQYSIDVPQLLTVLVPGAVNQFEYFLNDYIPTWDGDNYAVDRIQWPLQRDVDNIMDQNFWTETLDPKTAAPILRFARNDPGNGNIYSVPQGDFVIWYLAPHFWDFDNNTCTVPKRHVEAVAQLAACKMLELVSRVAVQFSDQQVFPNKDMGSLTQRLADQAKTCMAEYERLTGKDEQAFEPTWASWYVGGNDWMPFHPRSYNDG